MATIAAPVFNQFIGDPYSQWATTYYSSDPANGADGASPLGDGVPNLLKYFAISIRLSHERKRSRRFAGVGLTSISGSSYLTLSFRQNREETALRQRADFRDLQTWQTVAPITSLPQARFGDRRSVDAIPGRVAPSGAAKEFIRLNLVAHKHSRAVMTQGDRHSMHDAFPTREAPLHKNCSLYPH